MYTVQLILWNLWNESNVFVWLKSSLKFTKKIPIEPQLQAYKNTKIYSPIT